MPRILRSMAVAVRVTGGDYFNTVLPCSKKEKKVGKKKNYSTRGSQMVTHSSTNLAI